MNEAECRRLAGSTAVARLATTRTDGRVDLVPVVFAFDGADLVFAVDHKPKRTQKLQRLANIEANPAVTVLFDHYAEDWDTLWWVRLRGRAQVSAEEETAERARDALQARHPQYRDRRPAGPVVRITPQEWSGWSAVP